MADIFSALGSRVQSPVQSHCLWPLPFFLDYSSCQSHGYRDFFFFFWTGLCCILVAACRVLLVAVSEGYPPVPLLVLLTVMVSLAAEHSL